MDAHGAEERGARAEVGDEGEGGEEVHAAEEAEDERCGGEGEGRGWVRGAAEAGRVRAAGEWGGAGAKKFAGHYPPASHFSLVKMSCSRARSAVRGVGTRRDKSSGGAAAEAHVGIERKHLVDGRHGELRGEAAREV